MEVTPMLGWFVETTLVAGVLALVAALAPRVRTLGPATRHALWLVVLVKLLTPPLLPAPWVLPVDPWLTVGNAPRQVEASGSSDGGRHGGEVNTLLGIFGLEPWAAGRAGGVRSDNDVPAAGAPPASGAGVPSGDGPRVPPAASGTGHT